MADKDNKARKITLIYMGRRIGFDGKVLHAFGQVNSKKEWFWSRVRWCEIGHKYQCDRFKDGRMTMSRTPDSVGEAEIDPKQLELWKVQDQAAAQRKKMISAANGCRRFKLWDKTLAELSAIYKQLTWAEQRGFEQLLIEQIAYGPNKHKRRK